MEATALNRQFHKQPVIDIMDIMEARNMGLYIHHGYGISFYDKDDKETALATIKYLMDGTLIFEFDPCADGWTSIRQKFFAKIHDYQK